MAKNKFSKLYFDINKVSEWIKIWCETNLDEEFSISTTRKTNRTSYSIICSTPFMIDFLDCTGGAYTIQYKLGQNQTISEKLAESIYNRITAISSATDEKNSFSVVITEEIFKDLIDLLDNTDECTQIQYDNKPELGYILYKYQSDLGDTTTIKFYLKNDRIQLQGRPLYLFHLIQDILLSNETIAEPVVEEQLRYYNISESIDDIQKEMKDYFGEKLYNFFPTTHRMILHSVFVMAKVDIELPEYSSIASPVFRVVDGFIFRLMTFNEDIERNNEMVGEFFEFNKVIKRFELIQCYKDKIKSEKKIKTLEFLYSLCYDYRHPYSHTGENDTKTKVIETRKKADDIIKEIFDAMKTSYYNWE